jgi:hypothetical protein
MYPSVPDAVAFTLSVHADIPMGPGGWSIPGEVLWMRQFDPGTFFVQPFMNGEEGWYDPSEEYYQPVADFQCWEYIFYLDSTEFIQQGTPDTPVVYWLDVQAFPLEPLISWGWKTSLAHWNDDAVWALGQDPPDGPWTEMRYPIGHPFAGQSIDLAFTIIGVADTCAGQYPGDANSDGVIDMDDVDYLHKAIDSGGPAPNPKANGDANGDCYVNYIDIHYVTQVATSVWPEDSLVDCTCLDPEITCCSGDYSGNTNCDWQYKRNLADITRLIDYVYVSHNPLCCLWEGNTNGDVDHKINLADVTRLIDHVYVSLLETAPCESWPIGP